MPTKEDFELVRQGDIIAVMRKHPEHDSNFYAVERQGYYVDHNDKSVQVASGRTITRNHPLMYSGVVELPYDGRRSRLRCTGPLTVSADDIKQLEERLAYEFVLRTPKDTEITWIGYLASIKDDDIVIRPEDEFQNDVDFYPPRYFGPELPLPIDTIFYARVLTDCRG